MKIPHFILIVTALVLLVNLAGCRPSGNQAIPSTTPKNTVPTTTEPSQTLATTQAQITLPNYVEVFREGEVSKIPVVPVTGVAGNYAIAIDPEYFTFSPQETVDMFAYASWPGDMAVFFCVSPYTHDTQRFITDTVNQFSPQYQGIHIEDTTIGSYNAIVVYLSSFKDNPAYNKHIYLVDCGEDMYILEAQFVAEMGEGLYAIMRALFATFTAY